MIFFTSLVVAYISWGVSVRISLKCCFQLFTSAVVASFDRSSVAWLVFWYVIASISSELVYSVWLCMKVGMFVAVACCLRRLINFQIVFYCFSAFLIFLCQVAS